MINKFMEWIDGTYDNRDQSLSFPTMYSHVILTHCLLPNFFIYGEQKNLSRDGRIYRQFIVKPTLVDDTIVVKNFSFDKDLYIGFKNLNLIEESKLEYKPGCDTVFKYYDGEYVGGIIGYDCKVVFDNEETFVKNHAKLGKDYYHVYDKGFSVKTEKQVWGSSHRHYQFKKIDKGYLWVGG